VRISETSVCDDQDTYFESNSVQEQKLLVDQRIFEVTLLLTEQALQNFCQALLSLKISQLSAARNSNSTKFHYDNWLSNANVLKGFMTRQPVAQFLPRTKRLIHTIIVKEEPKT
jgi:hypothetical protein